MAYVTQTDAEERIGGAEVIRLTDDAVAGVVGADALAKAITEGEAELLNDIGQRYVLPLVLAIAETAAAIRSKLLDAVIYRLHARRPPVPEDVGAAYERAIDWAKSIAKGERGLVGETELSTPPAAGGRIIIEAGERVISRESMAGL